MNRRHFFKNTALASGSLLLPAQSFPFTNFNNNNFTNKIRQRIFSALTSPVLIESIELLKTQGKIFLLVRSKEGITGITVCNERMENLYSLFKGLIVPFYLNKDAREIVKWSEDVFLDERNYKYGGMPFWNCAGSVEIAIWDLLGRAAQKPVHHFLGNKVRNELPVYLSSLTRETTAEQETAFLQQKLSEYGATAVKIKVGGRMRNTPEYEARTQAFVPMARKVLGNKVTIYADANGSYHAEDGIRVAKLLEDYGVDIFEEPCAWEDYDANRKVNKTLKKMKLAGGEQDTSYYRFKEMAERGVYSVLQPDLYYNGGIIRALKVAELAAQHGKYFAPHSPKADPLHAPFSQLMAVAPAVYGFQEFPANAKKQQPAWYEPHILVKEGKYPILDGIGLGIEYDASIFKKAERI